MNTTYQVVNGVALIRHRSLGDAFRSLPKLGRSRKVLKSIARQYRFNGCYPPAPWATIIN